MASVKLGASLAKSKSKKQKLLRSKNKTPSRLNSQIDGSKISTLCSQTEVKQLDDFLFTAQATVNEFNERETLTFALPPEATTKTNSSNVEICSQSLAIPLKPVWLSSMTAEEVQEKEYSAFLEWRRDLAQIEAKENYHLTPFEKNFELWRQLWQVIDKSDVLIQTVDARNPLLFYSHQLDDHVKNVKKFNVILLNKADLLTRNQRCAWGKYLIQRGMKYAFFSALREMSAASGSESDEVVESSTNADLADGKILNRIELLSFLSQFCSADSEEPLTVGLVGFPNVGKSSVINSLLSSKRVCTSATPGKTKHFQTFEVTGDVRLCDCPGLVFPSIVSTKAELVLAGTLPIDQLQNHEPPVDLLVTRIPRHILQSAYGLRLPHSESNFLSNGSQLLAAYAHSRGFTTQRGLPNEARAARYILKDYVNGKLLFSHCPPGSTQSDYHTFPSDDDDVSEKVEATPLDDFDSFFDQLTVEAHVKSQKLPAVTPGSQTVDKPWKKHYNRNKRTKLRNLYAHLDK